MALSTDRWRGRLDGIIQLLLNQGIIQPGDTYGDVFTKVSQSDKLRDHTKTAFTTIYFKGLTQNTGVSDANEQNLGHWEVTYVKSTYPTDIVYQLAQDVDYVQVVAEQQELQRQEKKKRLKKRLKIWLPVLGVVIAAIIVYNLPYFAEKRAYDRIIGYPELYEIDEYLSKYDNPEHLPEVLYLKATLLLENTYNLHDAIVALEQVKERCPNSSQADRAEQKIDSLWNEEIAMFTKLNPDYESSKSLKAMYDMLMYMKANRIYDIALNITPHITLKEYTEYSKAARDILKSEYPNIENDIYSINAYFTFDDQQSLYYQLESEVQNAFERVFNNGFFKVTTEETDNNKIPQINLDYYISTQEYAYGGVTFPDVWVSHNMSLISPYVSDNSYSEIILGISIKFEAALKYPGQTNPWSITVNGAPEETINNVDGVADAYGRMTSICFEKFGKGLVEDLGLENEEEAAVAEYIDY